MSFLNKDMDNKDSIRTLIMLYEQHPCLYVTKSAEYHNKTKRLNALKTICEKYEEITGQPLQVEAAKKKINNLRSQYLDQLNKIQRSKSSGVSIDDVYKPTWWLFEDMAFLNVHVAAKRGESSIITPPNRTETASTLLTDDDISMDDLQYTDVCDILKPKQHKYGNDTDAYDYCSPTPSTSATCGSRSTSNPRSRKRKHVSPHKSDTNRDFWKTASDALKTVVADDKHADFLTHWTQYLEAELRQIKNRRRLNRLQIKIMELVGNELDNEAND